MRNLSNVNIHDQETDNQDTLSKLEAYELYDDMLNECYPSWNGYSPAHILKLNSLGGNRIVQSGIIQHHLNGII